MDENKKHSPRMVVEEIGESDETIASTKTETEAQLDTKPEIAEPLVKQEIPNEPSEPEEAKPVNNNKFNFLWMAVPGLLLLGLLMGGVVAYYNGLNRISEKSETTPTPEVLITPTPTPAETTQLNLSKYPISVLNGSGIAGEAGKVEALLETAGFNVSSTANAKTYDYDKTIISVKPEVEAEFIQALVSALTKNYQIDDFKTVSTQSASIIITVGSLKAK